MLSVKAKRNIYRIIPFGLLWLIFSLVYTILERGIIGNLPYYPATGNPYSFTKNIFVTPLAALITGLLIGTIEILYLEKIFIRRSFSRKIIYKSVIYLAIIIIFLLLLTAIANAIELNTSIFNKTVRSNVWAFFLNYAFLSVTIYMAVTIIISQFYTELSENIGREVLTNFFTGKYHASKEEERIFMFLDMKSSTTIAEKMGHVTYFKMLREYYADLSDSIVNYSGEIYQYVGDEMVISWKLKNGLQNNNCIECFFAMKEVLKNQSGKYIESFGIVPEFKAGIHLGKVTTGEIGIIKKDIIFTGDVLNTAARIQALCNTYKVDILISGDLVKTISIQSSFQIKTLGENELRGRNEKIELFTIYTTSLTAPY